MSFLDAMTPVFKILPEVKAPKIQQPLKKRLLITGLVLVLFYIMGEIPLHGISASSAGQLGNLQMILASKIGTIISAGIGPVVLASIILQLLVGSKIINIDLTDPLKKAQFTSMQKLLAIILSFFEAAVLTGFGGVTMTMISPLPGIGWTIWVIAQIALGSILLLYLDEVVSKYGFGSGIGLFIAGGVASEVFWRAFSPLKQGGQFIGDIPRFIQGLLGGVLDITALLPLIGAVLVFFVVVYAEGMHVNIPITMGRKGTGGRFPVKLLYVSNIPVILAMALFANFQILSNIFKGGWAAKIIAPIVKYTTAPYGLILNVINTGTITGGEIVHAIIFLAILVIACVVFGKFWVDLGGQGADAVADQLQASGMYVPGFRRDPRIIRNILYRYIPPITIIGSAFVGLLAGLADLTGALGSGTGILLTVGIVHRMYEELARQQVSENTGLIRKLLGG